MPRYTCIRQFYAATLALTLLLPLACSKRLAAAQAAELAFIGAAEPGPSVSSPLGAAGELKAFSLPPGFEIELVASEKEGVGKPITVTWDDSGRLWTITALEYPLDGNEQPEAAKALYEKGGRDNVLVFDRPYE